MSDATVTGRTIRPEDASHFGKMAAEWWNPRGSSAMLHRLNPVRLAFLREAIDRHWHLDSADRHPLQGKSALDVGCGAGLLCEPLSRLGADVTGVDAAPENVAAAAAHAEGAGFASPFPQAGGAGSGTSANTAHPNSSRLREGPSAGTIRYLAGELATLNLGQFDLVTAMEVIEHTADKGAFVHALARSLAPGGLLVLSTPNRTAASALLLSGAAEWVGAIPRGTHRWSDFITPDELEALLAAAGLQVTRRSGIAFSPMRGLHLSDNLALNYILSARRGD